MLNHSIRILFRILLHNRVYALTNIAGLSFGMAAALFILLVAYNELSFDGFHSKSEGIYQVVTHTTRSGQMSPHGTTPYPTAAALRKYFGDSLLVTQLHYNHEFTISLTGQNPLEVTNALMVDSFFFDIFDFDVQGDPHHKSMAANDKVYLTSGLVSQIEERYNTGFSDLDSIVYDNAIRLSVAGTVEDCPTNSHIPYNLIISYPAYERISNLDIDSWGTLISGVTYIYIPENVQVEAIEAGLRRFNAEIVNVNRKTQAELALLPLREAHFLERYNVYDDMATISKQYIWALIGIGFLILLIAAVNFVNLSTAQSMRRAREIGIRKVLGAQIYHLVIHYMAETVLLTFVSTLLALGLIEGFLPLLNQLLDNEISLKSIGYMRIIFFALGNSTFLILLSAIYPAYMLRFFPPVEGMKNQFITHRRPMLLIRKVLVALQFWVSTLLVILAIAVVWQMHFMMNKSMGFSPAGISVLYMPPFDSVNQEKLYKLVSQIEEVEQMSMHLAPPSSIARVTTTFWFADDSTKSYEIQAISVDSAYRDLYKLELVAGSWFPQGIQNDSIKHIVVNQQLAKRAGLLVDKLPGARIDLGINDIEAQIVGVVRNFHSQSLHQPIMPVVLLDFVDFNYTIGLKIRPENLQIAREKLQEAWTMVYPDRIFNLRNLEEELRLNYESDKRTMYILQVFSGIAILIATIGLLGLVSFMLESKNREISVRKVLGASTQELFYETVGQYLRILLAASLLAVPVSYFMLKYWLKQYAYHISLSPVIFILAVIVVIGLSLAAISYRIYKAANVNPAMALRCE